MRNLVCLYTLVLSLSVFGQAKVFKSCDSTINFDGKTQDFSLRVYKDASGNFSGEVEVSGGEVLEYDEVTINTFSVRAGLTGDFVETEDNELNAGERFVSHAMVIDAFMPSGIKLKEIREVTINEFVEQAANIGITAFAEAKDSKGKDLGSFMGGFLVSACK